MKRIIQLFLTLILTFSTIIIGLTFIQRLKLPYNSEGNYFDPVNSIVYHRQAVGVYGSIVLLLMLLLFIAAFYTLGNFRTKN